jgi:hypothetical protein
MSPTSASRRSSRTAGYTITELVVGTALSLIVLAAILAAYTFLGRNLTRMANLQQLEASSRRTMDAFAKDVNAASQINSCSAAQLVLQMPPDMGSISVTYDYNSASGVLTRVESAGVPRPLLTDLSTFAFTYFNNSGGSIAAGLNLVSIKSVEITFTASIGVASTGTLVSFSTVSPRVALRNKSPLVPM